MDEHSNIAWIFSGVGASLITLIAQALLNYRENITFNNGLSYKKSFFLAKKLAAHLVETNYLGNGKPQLILGIAGGGVMFADFISKNLQTQIPTICLFADLLNNPEAPFSKPSNLINKKLVPVLNSYDNFLIIQDIVRTGRTLQDLHQFFHENLPNKQYKVVSLVVCNRAHPKPDYSIKSVKNVNFFMPLTVDFTNRTVQAIGT